MKQDGVSKYNQLFLGMGKEEGNFISNRILVFHWLATDIINQARSDETKHDLVKPVYIYPCSYSVNQRMVLLTFPVDHLTSNHSLLTQPSDNLS